MPTIAIGGGGTPERIIESWPPGCSDRRRSVVFPTSRRELLNLARRYEIRADSDGMPMDNQEQRILEEEGRLLRSDLYELENRLDEIEAQIARLPKQGEPLLMLVGITLCSAALVILWIELFWRNCP